MTLFERYLFARVDSVRPWLLQRLFLVLFAFDCWVDHASHAGRYGFGDFNVAHFGWLDALAPTPSPGIYVGTILLAGLVAFAMAMTRPSRVGLGIVCALYTYGWAMSMLDSYQHHYLLSFVLLAMTFFPRLVRDDVFPVASERGVRVGGALLAYGLLELVVGVAGGQTPLGLFGPGNHLPTPAWIWLVRGSLALLGGLLAFLPKEEPKVDAPVATPEPIVTSAVEAPKGKRKKGKKQSKLQAPSPRADELVATKSAADPADSGKKSAKDASKGAASFAASRKLAIPTPNTVAWGYVLLTMTTAIVYFYTAITKMSGDWREGHALRRLGQSELLLGFESYVTTEGLPLFGTMAAATFWKLLGTGAILVQIVACVAYLLAPLADAPSSPRLRRWLPLFALAPLSFHLLTEVGLVLEIGWFSYYMLLMAFVVLAPARWLRVLGEGWSELSAKLAHHAQRIPTPARAALMLAALGLAGFTIDLPGALVATTLAALLALIGIAVALRDGLPLAGGGLAGATALSGVLLALAISQSEVRFDYYRFLGGEHRRHDEPVEALAAYEKANEHVLRPHCLYRGREVVECYRSEERARAIAAEHGLELRRRDRESEAEQMRRLIETRGANGSSGVGED
ncbi:MAG: HTTM domain-containing protein [Myxococcota bacterium]|nr:HTTM domain-containing protein [Myxococcota bacterium]